MLDLDTLLDVDDLYYTAFPEGWSFTWRLLTLREYRRYDALRSSGQFHVHYLYRKVFDRCYMGHKDLINQKMPMGIPVSIGHLIMWLSGDCEMETVKEQITHTRTLYGGGDLMEKLKRIILLAYPGYTPSELDKWNRVALLRRFVEAESMLIERYGESYKPLDVENIVPVGQALEPKMKRGKRTAINFDMENVAIKEQSHPYDEMDRIEAEYAAKQEQARRKPTTLTKAQAAKLDQMRG